MNRTYPYIISVLELTLARTTLRKYYSRHKMADQVKREDRVQENDQGNQGGGRSESPVENMNMNMDNIPDWPGYRRGERKKDGDLDYKQLNNSGNRIKVVRDPKK